MAYQQNAYASPETRPTSKDKTKQILQQRQATKQAAGATAGQTGAPAENPYAVDTHGDIAAYENYQYDYPIELMQSRGLTPQSFDLQRQQAQQTVQGGAQSGALGGMSSLASTSGLSEADRQAIMAQGQRQRVNLGQGAMAPINQMQAQNLYDTQQFNTTQGQQAADYNQKILNEKAMDVATQKERHAMNMYQARLQEAMLQRQLEKAAEIAAGQK